MSWHKTCPTCGTANDPAEMMCGRCLGDISGIAPVDAAPPEPLASPASPGRTVIERAPRLTLVAPDGRKIEVAPGSTVGRGFAGRELLEPVATVSRGHARFHHDAGRWFVEDLGAMNGTFLDGRRLEAGKREGVSDGQTLALSGRILFRIELKV